MGIKERVQLAWSIESLVCEDIESLVERKEQATKQITNLYQMIITAVEQELIDSIRRSIILWEGRWHAIMQAINETTPKRYQVVCWIPHGGDKAELFDYANGMDRLHDLKEMMPENRYELQEINPMDALAIKHKDIDLDVHLWGFNPHDDVWEWVDICTKPSEKCTYIKSYRETYKFLEWRREGKVGQ